MLPVIIPDSSEHRKAMQDAGYKEGDKLGGTMFPTLFSTL